MSLRVDALVTINEDVKKLISGWWVMTSRGRTLVPGLLVQLRETLVEVSGDENGNASGRSVVAKMPAREAPLSLVIEAETIAGRLAVMLGSAARSGSVEANLRFVEQRVDLYDDDVVTYVSEQLTRLVLMIEIELRWEEPSRRLMARCPHCTSFGTVAVALDKNGLKGASCSACEAIWGRSELGMLSTLMNKETR